MGNLGYAVTAHRAQGATVDTAHVIAAPGMTREAFYVAMTRGRYANHTHVITDRVTGTDQPAALQAASTQAILEHILANTGKQLSAHDTQARLEHEAQQWISRRNVDKTPPESRVPPHVSRVRNALTRDRRHSPQLHPLLSRTREVRQAEPRGIGR